MDQCSFIKARIYPPFKMLPKMKVIEKGLPIVRWDRVKRLMKILERILGGLFGCFGRDPVGHVSIGIPCGSTPLQQTLKKFRSDARLEEQLLEIGQTTRGGGHSR